MVQPTLRRSARIQKKKSDDSMVQPTLRRSARIRKQKNDDSTTGEPRLKRQLISRKSDELENKVSLSQDDYLEDGGSSTSQGECLIEQLPFEILERIFNCLAPPVVLGRKYFNSACIYLRLVCKRWCDILSHHQRVYFDQIVPHTQLENCGFGKIRLQLYEVDLSKLPLRTWKKIGCKINSLMLKYCEIGDQCLKNIIVHCCNLQSLEVVFEDNDDNADLFCSPDMLRRLRITRKNLRTFKIINVQKTVNVMKWVQIFKDFFKIFPNVEHFTSGCSYDRTSMKKFQLKFSKKLDKNDEIGIANSLAYSLSTNESHQRQAVYASTTLRLYNNASVCFMKNIRNSENRMIYNKIVSHMEKFECIEFIIDETRTTSVDWLKSILSYAIESVWYLEKLQYCKVMPLDRLHTPSELDLFKFHSNCHSLNWFIIHPSSNEILGGFAISDCCLKYLDVETFPITDDVLQKIFQHLIYLKILSIRVTYRNTNLGITGRHSSAPYSSKSTPSDNSIKRLKNLEELTLIGIQLSQMDDTIFYEFVFPKLSFLSIDPPDDPVKLFPIMGRNMPALVKIDFRSKIKNYENPEDFENFEKSLVSFSQHTKKLREIILRECILCETIPGFGISASGIINLFDVCPSLRSLEGRGFGTSSAYYDPRTRHLVIKDVHEKSTRYLMTKRIKPSLC